MASTRPGSPAPDPMSQTVESARDQLAQQRAVDQVPVPEPGRLARADQTADHAVGRQQLGVALGQGQAIRRKRPPRHVGRGGRFT